MQTRPSDRGIKLSVSDVKAYLRLDIMNAGTTLYDVNKRTMHTIILAVINHFSQTAVQYKSSQEVVRRRNVLFQNATVQLT